MPSSIAFLATGDEIVVGDILNTNAQSMARTLFSEQIFVSEHHVVRDDETSISNHILSLLETNDALIITGGLGPTTDDRTRFALAKALQYPLEFDDKVWQAIIDRLAQRYGMTNLPMSNQQQALFPKNAEILENPNGTAAGCLCRFQSKFIFMLPGPPSECLPMFSNYVLPILKKENFGRAFYFKNWLLFGVSEGYIAEKLEEALIPHANCQTGYRVTFPYLEFKLFSKKNEKLENAVQAVRCLLEPYLLTQEPSPIKASELLKIYLNQYPQDIVITDTATGGWFEQLIHTPDLNSHLYFNKPHTPAWHLELAGLEDYWCSRPNTQQVTLHLSLKSPAEKVYREAKVFLNYQHRNLLYAAEYASHFLLTHLKGA